jgi:hypothetical protein
MAPAGRDYEELLGRALARVQSPLEFAGRVLSARPTPQQREVLLALERGERRIAIRSGHGVGKSALLSWVLLWWLSVKPGAVIPCTAPTGHQLEDILWGEVSRWHRRMKEPFKSMISLSKGSARHRFSPESWFAVARTARRESPEALQGFHGKNLAFLIDEASGIPEEVFEVAEGALSTPGALVVMAGNPTRLEGAFYRAFHEERSHFSTFCFPSFASPLVDPSYGTRMAGRYGVDSDVYRVRVLGEFPKAEPDTLISLSLIEPALEREITPAAGELTVFGVDVARFGDDETVILRRRGGLVGRVDAYRGLDTMAVAGKVACFARAERPALIFVDVVGLGAGVADRLRELGFAVYPVSAGNRAGDSARFDDLRSELWWRVREWLESGSASLPPDGELVSQLSSIKYGVTSQGRIRVESKQERKKRGLSSPDRGDALMMTFASQALPPLNLEKGRAHRPFDRELGF